MAAERSWTDQGCTRMKNTPLFIPFQSLVRSMWVFGKWDGGRKVSRGMFGFMRIVSASIQLYALSAFFKPTRAPGCGTHKSHCNRRSAGFSSSCIRTDNRTKYLFQTPSRTGLRRVNNGYPNRRLCSSCVRNALS